MKDESEPKPRFNIGDTVYCVNNEHKVKKYKVYSIDIRVTKHILNSPFMKESDDVTIFYHLLNEHGNSVKGYWDFAESNLYKSEHQARMRARSELNYAIVELNMKLNEIKKIAEQNNQRIKKLEARVSK